MTLDPDARANMDTILACILKHDSVQVDQDGVIWIDGVMSEFCTGEGGRIRKAAPPAVRDVVERVTAVEGNVVSVEFGRHG